MLEHLEHLDGWLCAGTVPFIAMFASRVHFSFLYSDDIRVDPECVAPMYRHCDRVFQTDGAFFAIYGVEARSVEVP